MKKLVSLLLALVLIAALLLPATAEEAGEEKKGAPRFAPAESADDFLGDWVMCGMIMPDRKYVTLEQLREIGAMEGEPWRLSISEQEYTLEFEGTVETHACAYDPENGVMLLTEKKQGAFIFTDLGYVGLGFARKDGTSYFVFFERVPEEEPQE